MLRGMADSEVAFNEPSPHRSTGFRRNVSSLEPSFSFVSQFLSPEDRFRTRDRLTTYVSFLILIARIYLVEKKGKVSQLKVSATLLSRRQRRLGRI